VDQRRNNYTKYSEEYGVILERSWLKDTLLALGRNWEAKRAAKAL
jgi:hypothetical protein